MSKKQPSKPLLDGGGNKSEGGAATATADPPPAAAPPNGQPRQLARVTYEPNSIVHSQGTLKALMLSPSFQQALKDLLPKHLTPERLARMIIGAASRNPRLLQCTQASILKAAIESSVYGLDCTGLGARGYLIPYKNKYLSKAARHDVYEANFQAGYLGLCDLARRSGEIVIIYANAVFEGDELVYEEGLEQKLVHKPSLDADAVKTKETLKFVYAVATYRGGQKQFRVMTLPEVERHRGRSRAKDNGPWVTDYIAMALKTVTRQLCKWLPQSAEMSELIGREEQLDTDDAIDVPVADPLKPTDGRQPWGFPTEEDDPATRAEADRQVDDLKKADAGTDVPPEAAAGTDADGKKDPDKS